MAALFDILREYISIVLYIAVYGSLSVSPCEPPSTGFGCVMRPLWMTILLHLWIGAVSGSVVGLWQAVAELYKTGNFEAASSMIAQCIFLGAVMGLAVAASLYAMVEITSRAG